MEKKIIKYLLENLKKDYLEGHIYREDTIKSCIYHHLKHYFGEKDIKYIYTEVRNIKTNNGRQKFDLVISKKPLYNGEKTTDIVGYDSIECIIEIKYIFGTLSDIEKSLHKDIVKLNEAKDIEKISNSSKNIFFIWENTETTELDLKKLKEFLTAKEQSKLNIFGLLFNYSKGVKNEIIESYIINNQEKQVLIKN